MAATVWAATRSLTRSSWAVLRARRLPRRSNSNCSNWSQYLPRGYQVMSLMAPHLFRGFQAHGWYASGVRHIRCIVCRGEQRIEGEASFMYPDKKKARRHKAFRVKKNADPRIGISALSWWSIGESPVAHRRRSVSPALTACRAVIYCRARFDSCFLICEP